MASSCCPRPTSTAPACGGVFHAHSGRRIGNKHVNPYGRFAATIELRHRADSEANLPGHLKGSSRLTIAVSVTLRAHIPIGYPTYNTSHTESPTEIDPLEVAIMAGLQQSNAIYGNYLIAG
jgi:hypothetical protein